MGADGCRESGPVVAGRTWVGIVANANSGIGRGRDRVERLAAELRARGLVPRIAWTPDERSALVAGSARDPDCRCLAAVGGDGTVSALVNERPGVPITVLASGTENLFARHFGLSKRPESAAETIARGRVARIDLGHTAGQRFTLMAGFGFDADVVTRHHAARLGAAGRLRPTHRGAYVEPILRSSWEYRFPPLAIRIDDPGREEDLDGTTAFVFNLPRYALGLPIAPTARADDGLLDLVVFREPGPFRALHYLWMVFRGLHLRRPGVMHRRVRRLTITAAGPVPVQLDGDPGGTLTVEPEDAPRSVEVLPGAIDIFAPDAYFARHPALIAS